jgi:hypothetical protein
MIQNEWLRFNLFAIRRVRIPGFFFYEWQVAAL